jgi:IMP dehydrogenase
MSLSDFANTRSGLTFDDVLLVPRFSEVLPRDVSLVTKFTREITLQAPIVSAAMDTVTESKLAIAMAQQGGIGVIHKNMSIQAQANEVRKVKRSEAGMVMSPITLTETSLVGDAVKLMREHGIGGIPVVDDEGFLKGIVTNRDLRFEKVHSRPVVEIMTKDNIVTTTTKVGAEEILQRNKIEKLPVVDSEGRLIGLITYRDIIKVKTYPNACKDEHGRLRCAGALGVTADTLERCTALVDAGVDAVVIDTAHGHTRGVVEKLKQIKEKFPQLQCVVGNIATAEAAKFLAEAGADAVKVGIGPGSICSTRVVAGVGVPQLSAINDVAVALEGTGVPVIADGGIRYSGDVVKAIAAGADCVMFGSMFAGVEESPGETLLFNGRKFKAYRGMGSVDALQAGSKDRYFQTGESQDKLVPEGIAGRVAYKGHLHEVTHQILGGLRAGMGYCGAPSIDKLKGAPFIKQSAAGIIESHPHDVVAIADAPNYSVKSP